jgi:hypothetical protein
MAGETVFRLQQQAVILRPVAIIGFDDRTVILALRQIERSQKTACVFSRGRGRARLRQQALAMAKTEYARALTVKVAEFLKAALGDTDSTME